MKKEIVIIGGGLAGSEAAYQILKRGGRARVIEMKPVKYSPAHTLPTFAELVCSNSLKSDSIENASGLLKEEMRLMGSLVIRAAEATRVPAGKTLAVDRTEFSRYITGELERMGAVIERAEAVSIPADRPLIIATGPLTSDAFAGAVSGLIGRERLYFFDAVAPIVYKESIDFEKAFKASRYGKGGDDYINCPFSEDEYERFYSALTAAEGFASHEFDSLNYFEGCMPIEELARRGPKTLLFGPMRPVGLRDPRTQARPFAIVQLRRENQEDTLYNIVGFQTRMTIPEQKRVFRLIPGLEKAEFARFGKLHRNSYIDSPSLLNKSLQLKGDNSIFFAGQMTGVEGYVESAVSGLLAGMNACRLAEGRETVAPPPTTMTGALLAHITAPSKDFQPMNANMGLLPELPGKDRRERQAERALKDMKAWVLAGSLPDGQSSYPVPEV
ncbi:MAG: methylenetetrahydrofolate--tRNA-(uracil(54)-C(5))-methyltransferase (FADH(2)-oxidizing) TrmFO [Deltaproteobacteria bacterium]|nr:methylenetetrahydrofolate--tRNA-(uracil(54)-C(5))-methyltransferase (FADH(2)-oxidizing) TrmFO [Deltaproteobacteria bacterium]